MLSTLFRVYLMSILVATVWKFRGRSPSVPPFLKVCKTIISLLETLQLSPLATAYDTPAAIVKEVTYQPPTLLKPGPAGSLTPMRPAREQTYINSIWNGAEFNNGMLTELHMTTELSNPHSRAKKQKRWQEKQERERTLLKELIKAETRDRRGRSSGELRKVAVFKWKLQLHQEERAEKRRRWLNRGMQERAQKKAEGKAKKAAKTSERLLNLVLKESPNQVIPA
jgi:hypothetical protein